MTVPGGVTVGASVHGGLVVVAGRGDGPVVMWVSSGGELFAADIAGATGVQPTAIVEHAGAAILVGSDYERLLPRVWMWTDGRTWSEVATSGLEEPAEMIALAAAPDALYAVGGYREGLDGEFRPAIWRSADGQRWEAVTAPDVGARGHVSGVVATGDSVIVAAQGEAGPSMWWSVDDGDSWIEATIDVGSNADYWTVQSVAHRDDRLVAAGSFHADTGSTPLILVSSDGGVTWSTASIPDTLAGDAFDSRVIAAAGAFLIATSEYNGAFSNPDVCYRDLRSCQGGPRPVLMRSLDGTNWVEIDLAPLSISSIEGLVEHPEHGLTLVGQVAGTARHAAWAWPAGTEPPRRPPPAEPPPGEPPLAGAGGELTVGTTYRYPLHIHCGMGVLGDFNGRWWTVVAGSTEVDPELGAGEQPPTHWPVAEQAIFGMITRVDDTIEYSLPSSEVIAVYEPATTDPQLCA